MSRVGAWLPAVVAVIAVVLTPSPARAHCDTLSGPVVKAARQALEAKNLRPVLKWVKADVEPELQAAFEKTLAVRAQGAAARELADRYFFETVVRLHRAGEGAPYTGLRAEAEDPQGMIAASDLALERRSADPLQAALAAKVASGLRARYERVVETRKHAEESVTAGREFVEAYVQYVHFVEAVQATLGPGGHAVESGHRHEQ